jgi:flagellin
MRELAVQSASDTNTDDDRTQIQSEIDQLTQEVDRIANTTEFNTKKLLNGDRKGAVSQKFGTNSIEGTFTNALVSTVTGINKNSALAIVSTDVIRIEIGEEGKLSSATVKSLHGSDAKVSVGTTNDKTIKLLKDLFYKVDTATGIMSDAGQGDDISFKVEKASMLKAGDVITITLGEAVKTESAATGKDALRLQVGANAGQEVTLGINSMRTSALDICNKETGTGLDVSTQNGASMAINAYDMAIQKVSTERAKMGAMQNRLEHTIANLDSAAENTQNSESRIRDTDMAAEMVEFSKNNILAQAGQSMLAQANQSNQGVLSLLG